jgi:hypothetical protein
MGVVMLIGAIATHLGDCVLGNILGIFPKISKKSLNVLKKFVELFC